MKTNPTKVSTTLCTTEKGVSPLVVGAKVNSLRGTRGVRGCCKLRRPLSNERLFRENLTRTETLKMQVLSTRIIKVNNFSAFRIGAATKSFRTHDIVLTAKDEETSTEVPKMGRFRKGNIDCYTMYSTFFCEKGRITILKGDSFTLRRTRRLSRATSHIAVFASKGGPRFSERGPLPIGAVGVRTVRKSRHISNVHLGDSISVRRTNAKTSSFIPTRKIFMTLNATKDSRVTHRVKTRLGRGKGVQIGRRVRAAIPKLCTTNSYANKLLRITGTIRSNTRTKLSTYRCIQGLLGTWTWTSAGGGCEVGRRFCRNGDFCGERF